jgi:hypothetical protein
VSSANVRWLLVVSLFAVVGMGQAFSWAPFEFPPGDQGYTMEVVSGEGVARFDLDLVDRGGAFDVTTIMTVVQSGVAPGSMSEAMFGGSGMSMFAFGPLMLFGTSYFLMPLLLGQEDIAVRDAPIEMKGVGRMYLEREEVVAGRTCVVLRVELEGGDGMEFAVAEGVPLPCFTRYGSGSEAVEVRLIEIR